MNTSLFIRTCVRDQEWLKYCLAALAKYATGFRETVVCIRKRDERAFANFDFGAARVVKEEAWLRDDYIGQQLTKCTADRYCAGEYIMHVDSDCIAQQPFSPEQFFTQDSPEYRVGEKTAIPGPLPVMLYRPWENAGDAAIWRESTRYVLGFEPPQETMCTHPIIHPRALLQRFRRHVEAHHGKEFMLFIASLHKFSEFNAIGNYAAAKEREVYVWREADPAKDNYPRPFKQYWTGELLSAAIRAEIEAKLS